MPARYREILSHAEMCVREETSLQRGMNFNVRGGAAGYSVILMSVRKGAPYQDQWHDEGEHAGMLEYEGHDRARKVSEWPRGVVKDAKKVDQPMRLASGKLTDNGKFFAAAEGFKAGEGAAEVVQVYEKIIDGVWCDRGRHELVDAVIKDVPTGKGRVSGGKTRQVFRFFLRPTATPGVTTREEERELSISRQIPTAVKQAVFIRDQGKCVQCGAMDNLHFDHDVPFSKGGSSITVENVKLLCARHNLQKSDKILSLGPLLGPLVAAALAGAVRGA
ncbi:MAG: hypothetical protein QM783_13300 [Phycisphaerales bacterium]